MSHLFYFVIPRDSPKEGEIILQGEEGHHAIRVVRMKVGEPIAFIDGAGGKWLGEVVQISRDSLTAKIKCYQYVPRNEKQLTLIIGSLHRDTAVENIINYGTELGVSSFYFFEAEHSTRLLRLDKAKRWAIQACKTTGREWFPEIKIFKNLQTALVDFEGALLIADTQFNAIPICQLPEIKNCGLIIGPEGDLTENEREIAVQYGAISVHLGPRILRSETSALVGSIILLQKQFYSPPKKDFPFDE